MQADEANREICVGRVVALEEAALPRLFHGLAKADDGAALNIESALCELARNWQTLDPRSLPFLEELRGQFPVVPAARRAALLRAATVLLNQGSDRELLPVGIAHAAADMIKAADADQSLRPEVLQLAGALVARVPPGQWLNVCRNLASKGLTDPDPKARVAALHLTMREAMQTEHDILEQAVPLLRDSEAEVRRAAVLALGPAQELVSEDDLLPLLHDQDARVQQLCELVLRGRGLQDRHLELARLISDDNPAARLQVVQHLRGGSDLDVNVWLRRLSQDQAPAVRAAAIRAAAAQGNVDLRDRLAEMTRDDASPTVRELAAHYLARVKLE
jgi:HEAT repeat protein